MTQTANMGLDHDKAHVQFYKEASNAATETLKVQVQSFDETLAMACEQIVVARRERDDTIRLDLSQQASMATQFASINAAIRR